MAKISVEAKNRYFDKIKQYKSVVEAILNKERILLKDIRSASSGTAYKQLQLADEILNMVSYVLLMNSLSVTLLGIRNDSYLNEARKGCYKSIIYLEEVVSNIIDAPFSEYEGRLKAIEEYKDQDRYSLVQKLGFSIQSVIDGFGENSKWKWSFVELEGRFATVAKNLINLRTLVEGLDPVKEGYESRVNYLNLVKKLLAKSADGYRQKYELSTSRMDDFKLAIYYLSALRRLHVVLGEGDGADTIKKKIEIWKTKMEKDSLNKERKNKMLNMSKENQKPSLPKA